MLKQVKTKQLRTKQGSFAIIASRFNAEYVDSMVQAATSTLKKAGAKEVRLIQVPGAYEIMVVAGHLSRQQPREYDAVLCFGVVFRGETTHAQHISESISLTLAQLQAQQGLPLIHGVYLFENERQARVRCLDPKHNRGVEIAQTALEMVELMKNISR